MGRPLVSILLPSLNARQFLEPRIDSLLAQTFGDWEAIVLDSHSTDGTWELLQSIASADSRFRLTQVPREGLYAALNRGVQLAMGEFLHIATCDDTMAPEFLYAMINALAQCPEAGIAACDLSFINQDGHELFAGDMAAHLSKKAIKNLLGSGRVRTAFPTKEQRELNYRPVPHDCLLHFSGRSVYFSLTQLVVRMGLARAVGPFETTVGSVADFGWLVRLTSMTGSVHLPRNLATWRFHGDQLSVQRDNSRISTMKRMCQGALLEVRSRNPGLLTQNDCEALLLSYKTRLAGFSIARVGCWAEALIRLLRMFVEQPGATLRALCRANVLAGTRREFLLSIIFRRIGLTPGALNVSQ